MYKFVFYLSCLSLCLNSAAQMLVGGGTSPARSGMLDLSLLSGVDCTGAADSSTALNNQFDSRRGGNINGKYIWIPPHCQLQLRHKVVIFGQSYFVMDGGG